MAPKLLAVIGATGIQGGSVVKAFLGDPEWRIRGLTRNTSSASAQKLKEKGVEVVSANLDDVSSLVAAFKGANAVFSVTDFWGPYFNPENRTKARPGQAMNEFAYEYELQQGKNVFDAAAQTEGLQRLIFSSLSNAAKWSKGKYTHVYHFDSKAKAAEYGQATYPRLWEKTSIIQVGFYLSNALVFPMLQPRKDENGVYTFSSKLRGDVKLPMVATEEDTGPFTKALLASEPGKNLIAYRAWMSQDEFTDLWGRILGVKARNLTLPADDPLQSIPEDLRKEMTDMMGYFEEFGYEARDDPTLIHPKDLGIALDLGTVEEWIKKQDWSPILGS